MSKKPKSSIGNQSATKYKKPTNGKSLVHDFANGINADIRVGNLSFNPMNAESGILSTALYSYALRIGHRIENFRKKQVTFVCYDGTQSVTTRKHMGFLSRSIPLPVTMHPAPTAFEELTAEGIANHFAYIKQMAKEDFKKPKSKMGIRPLEIYMDKVNGAMLDPLLHANSIYQSYCGQIEDFLNEISNPRISRIPAYSAKYVILDIEKAKEFRKRFCPLSPAHNFRHAEKIVTAYLFRIQARKQKRIEKAKIQNDLADSIVSRNLPVFDSVISELQEIEKTYSALHKSAWLNYEKVSHDVQSAYFSAKRNQIQRICDLSPLDSKQSPCFQSYELVCAYDRVSGKNWDSQIAQTQNVALLRVSKSGEEIETSHGANLPLLLCQSLWKRHGQIFSQIIAGESVADKLPIALGHFSFSDVTDGVCRVGCHRIKAEEFVSLAQRLNWKS